MILKPIGFGQKAFLIFVESVLVLTILLGLGLGALIWRAGEGPIEIGFAKKFIESELSDPAHHIALQVGQITLSWARDENRPEVTLRDVSLINTLHHKSIVALESASVSFSRIALIFGHVEPRSIIISKPLIHLVRDSDNHITLALADNDSNAGAGVDIFSVLEQLSRPRREMPHGWPLRSLHTVQIRDARMMVEDHAIGQSWLVPRADIALRRIGGAVTASAALWLENDSASPEKAQPALSMDAAYDHTARAITLDMTMAGLKTAFLATRFPSVSWLAAEDVKLDGHAIARIDSTMKLSALKATVETANGQVMIPGAYDHIIPYKKITLSLSYDAAQKTLTLLDSPIILRDDAALTLSGSITQTAENSFTAPLHIHLNRFSQASAADYWPTVLKDDPSGEWIVHRLSKGRLLDSDATIDLTLQHNPAPAEGEKPWVVKLADIKAKFAFDGMTIHYRDPLMPVTDAAGRGQYDRKSDRLRIDVTKGRLSDIAIKSGTVTIDTVAGKAVGQASIDLNAEGPVKTLLKYLTSEPINVHVPTDIARAKGDAVFKVNVSFPTLAKLPAEKINVTASGIFNNLLLPGLVHNLDVTGGPVKLKIADRQVIVSGTANLDGHPAQFTFDQYFESKDHDYASHVAATLDVNEDLRHKFGLDLADWLAGTVPAKITYTQFPDHRARVDVSADATQATLFVKPMNYTKPPGAPAQITATALLQNDILESIQNLNIDSKEATVHGGQISFIPAGKGSRIRKGNLPQARLLASNAAITFDIPRPGHMALSVKGPALDITPFLEGGKRTGDYTGPAITVKIQTDKMITGKGQSINGANAVFDMDNQGMMNRLDLNAHAGRGALAFHYKLDSSNRKTILSIDAEDAGAALRAFEIYENARGGTLSVTGESAPGGNLRTITGTAEMRDFKIVNAPTLARLVNAISLPGILELLGGNGINFSRLKSHFTWVKDKGVDKITVKDGRTSGASIGLTFDGAIDRMQDRMDINGTIVPVSLVNDVIGSIPVLGDILSGGSKGGVFAATYSVKGTLKDPSISVNPLSVLTPGFLRRIFFEKN